MITNSLTPPADLAEVLVRMSRERGTGIEHLRAEQLLTELREAWPGDPTVMWTKWFQEGAKSLGLHSKMAYLTVEDALLLVEDGAMLVGEAVQDGSTRIILGFDGKKVSITSPNQQDCETISPEQLSELTRPSSIPAERSQTTKRAWLIVEDLELSHAPPESLKDRPITRFIALVRPEWSDIWVVCVFAFFAGVLSLATPIAVESLVNEVSFGQLLQPLLILSLMLFAFLAFAAMMQALQTFVVEIIQRRLFARVAADLAYRFPRVSGPSLDGKYGPELANRFFDVVTLQKVTAQLLLDGLAIILATFVGMAVLAFYHPWLLGFDVLLLLLVVGGVILLGRGAISSGIDESKQKYRLAAWLEEVIRCPLSFRTAGACEFALDRANMATADYLESRKKHFTVLFRQLLFILGLQAIAGTVLLGFGGWLVIQRELTLGQLVAAELIVATILGSLAKLGKHIEGFYDVVAAVDKLGYLFDLDIERQDGLLTFRPQSGVRIRVTEVQHSKGGDWLKKGCSMDVEKGERVAMLGSEFAGSNLLFDMLFGLRLPESGHIEIEDADPRDLRPEVLRETVTLIRKPEIFEGTIVDNVLLGRTGISMTNIRSALHAVRLLDTILHMPNGLDTKLTSSGAPLMASQLQLLMVARGLVGRQSLLMIDGTLDNLGDAQLETVFEAFREEPKSRTILIATNRRDVANKMDRIIEVNDALPTEPVLPTPES